MPKLSSETSSAHEAIGTSNNSGGVGDGFTR
jgi:hypothetical protein